MSCFHLQNTLTLLAGHAPMTLTKNRLLILISFVLTLPTFGQSNSYHISGALELPIKKGPVFIYLVDRGHFNIPNSGLDTIKIEVTSTILQYEFSGVPQGTYAIRCVQDLNGNNILDKGLFGPSEPWALSWNRKKRFPPKFGDISFTLTSDITINMKLEK